MTLDYLWNRRFCASERRRCQVDFGSLSPNQPVTAGADNAPRPHCPNQPIRCVRQTRDRRRAEEDVGVAGWATDPPRPGRSGPPPRRGARDRTARSACRGGAALCASQAIPPAELRGIGLPSRGLRVVSGLRPTAVALEPEEVGAAQDDQRDPSRDLGGDQSDAASKRFGSKAPWQGSTAMRFCSFETGTHSSSTSTQSQPSCPVSRIAWLSPLTAKRPPKTGGPALHRPENGPAPRHQALSI